MLMPTLLFWIFSPSHWVFLKLLSWVSAYLSDHSFPVSFSRYEWYIVIFKSTSGLKLGLELFLTLILRFWVCFSLLSLTWWPHQLLRIQLSFPFKWFQALVSHLISSQESSTVYWTFQNECLISIWNSTYSKQIHYQYPKKPTLLLGS